MDAHDRAEKNVHHVYPTYGRKHDTDGGDCWCAPRRESVANDDRAIIGWLVIHREEN